MQSFQFLINSMKAFTTVIWEFVAATKSVCVKHFPSLSSLSLSEMLPLFYCQYWAFTHTHTYAHKECAHLACIQKVDNIKPIAFVLLPDIEKFCTERSKRMAISVAIMCSSFTLFVCVRVCVLNLVVDLSLLSALCAALCAQLHPFAALLVILSFTC